MGKRDQDTDRIAKMAGSVIGHLDKLGMVDPEEGRRVIGTCLSSVHTVILMEAKGSGSREKEREAVLTCVDSLQRIITSLKASIDRAGIEGCTIEFGSADGQEVTLQ